MKEGTLAISKVLTLAAEDDARKAVEAEEAALKASQESSDKSAEALAIETEYVKASKLLDTLR